MAKKQITKHKYLRRVGSWCLVMITFISFATFVTAWHAGEQIAPATIATLVGGFMGELVLSYFKRKDDTKAEKPTEETKTEIPKNETI
jgi:predicted CDP-diglyceride synthetase/phosphatidate cytidylyltransferase